MSKNYQRNGTLHRDYGATYNSASSIILNKANGSCNVGGSSSECRGDAINHSSCANPNIILDVNFSAFSPTEFMSLSEDIAHNIQSVNSVYKQLEKIYKILSTPRDQQTVRNKVHNLHTKTNRRIEITSVDLQRLSAIVSGNDKQQKLQLEKLTNDFRLVVEKYFNIQQRITMVMRQAMLPDLQIDTTQWRNINYQGDSDIILEPPHPGPQYQQIQNSVLLERERQVKEIEANVLDIKAIMNTIRSLTEAQSYEIERIENNAESASIDVQVGHEELIKASRQRRRYRCKLFIFVLVAVIIGLIVTGITVNRLTT